MKIIVGISHVKTEERVDEYIRAGADEFFVGYVPPAWYQKYGWEVSCNRRQTPGAQYENRDDLSQVVDLIKKKGKKVYLTLNEHEYTSGQVKDLLHLIHSIEDIPFDAYIVANLALIHVLRKNGINKTLNVSIGLGCNNVQAIEFIVDSFENIGRFVLPRKLRMSEIESIAKFAVPRQIKLEAFGISSPCMFNDDYCFSWHSGKSSNLCRSPFYNSRQVNPIVFDSNWKEEVNLLSGNDIIARQFKVKEKNERTRNQNLTVFKKRKALEKDKPRAFLLEKAMETCGLCAITKFKEFGIDAIKIAFRGLSFSGIEMLEMTKKVINDPKANTDFCKGLIKSPAFCNGENCYYDYPYTD